MTPSRPTDPVLPGRSVPLARYPIAFAAVLVVQLVIHAGVGPYVAGRTLIIAIAVALLLSVAGRLIFRDPHLGGIFAVLAILLIVGGTDPRIAALLGIGMVLLFAQRFVLRPERRMVRWSAIGRAANAVTAVFVLAIGIQALQVGALGAWAQSLAAETRLPGPATALAVQSDAPDIYVILLDGYARSDALASVFDHDDTPFTAALADRGFDVAAASRANYPLTAQTLASMFHMALLNDIEAVGPLLDDSTARPPGAVIRETINRNPTFDFLRARGYSIMSISSGFEEVALREADVFIDTGELNEFEIGMLRRTVAGDLLPLVAPDFVSSQYRTRLTRSFGELALIAGESARPRFVLAHIASPHPPWVHHADGSPRTVADIDATYADTPASTGLTIPQLKAGYVGAVEYLHAPVIAAVDEIVRRSARPPVIVLFGDHGSWIGADGGDIRLRFLTLFAARMPDGSRPFPDDIQLVNVFPILLNRVFGQDIPLVAESPSYRYRFREYDLVAVPDPNGALRAPAATP